MRAQVKLLKTKTCGCGVVYESIPDGSRFTIEPPKGYWFKCSGCQTGLFVPIHNLPAGTLSRETHRLLMSAMGIDLINRNEKDEKDKIS